MEGLIALGEGQDHHGDPLEQEEEDDPPLLQAEDGDEAQLQAYLIHEQGELDYCQQQRQKQVGAFAREDDLQYVDQQDAELHGAADHAGHRHLQSAAKSVIPQAGEPAVPGALILQLPQDPHKADGE